ncbi:MAG TPA: hypothetical protein VKF39_05160 [Nitrososphaerales archaeon]|nr:hypothetical protein [Nitrososphaerales archaeon]
MRFFDLAVAGVISITAVALLIAWNPQAPDVAARRNLDEAHLRDFVTGAVETIGLVRIAEDSPGDLCTLLGSFSNSTVTFSANVEGFNCGAPPAGAAVAEIEFAFGPKVVVLESWFAAGP